MTSAVLPTPVRTGWRWRYALFGTLGLLGLGLTPAPTTAYVILLTAVGFLLAGMKRPALIVVAIVLVELTIGTQPEGLLGIGVNTRYIFVFLAAMMTIAILPFVMTEQRRTPGIGRVLVPAAVLVILVGLATSNGLTPELLVQAVRYYMFGLVMMVLAATLINTPRDAKFVGIAAIVIFTLSGATAILQHFTTAWGIPAPSITGKPLFSSRALGLSESPVKLGNDLMIGALVVWGLIGTLTVDHRNGRLLMFAFLLVSGGLYFTYTRSGLYGVALAVVCTVFFLHRRIRKEVILALILVAPVMMFFLVKDNSRYTLDVSEDDSAASRFVLWNIGVRIAMDHPVLGIGYDAWDAVAMVYAADIVLPDELLGMGIERSAADFPVHNDFLRVWLSFGTPALATFILFHIGIAFNYFLARRKARSSWIKGASTGGIAALVGYTINSLFHNYVDTTMAFWLLAGFSVVLLKLATAESATPELSDGK